MAKFLKVGTSGFATEEAAINVSAGAGDANKIIETNGSGKLDSTFLPAGVGNDSKSMTTGEALSAGNLVYISNTGTVLKADANAVAKAAVGYVTSSAASGASVTVFFEGTISGLTGLTPGATYFLSDTTTGGVSLTIPSNAGDIVQAVGIAVSATELTFEPQTPIVRA
ncbi:MAG: hypothetical protein ACR2K1_00985 [Saprospiraceae bacterium]